jgi:hypothetical protein
MIALTRSRDMESIKVADSMAYEPSQPWETFSPTSLPYWSLATSAEQWGSGVRPEPDDDWKSRCFKIESLYQLLSVANVVIP